MIVLLIPLSTYFWNAAWVLICDLTSNSVADIKESGYFSANGEFDTCIALRTAVAKNKKFYVQAGAGIVADSKPKNEYDEEFLKYDVKISIMIFVIIYY